MALTPFFGSGRNSIFDPFDLSFWDSTDLWPSNFIGKNVGKDVQVVANTRIDWVETPEAHVFKADLPNISQCACSISHELCSQNGSLTQKLKKRLGATDDMAVEVAFFASDDAAYIRGKTFVIRGVIGSCSDT